MGIATLPQDLVSEMCHCVDHNTLKEVRLVSRGLGQMATEHLFSTICINVLNDSTKGWLHIAKNEGLSDLATRAMIAGLSLKKYIENGAGKFATRSLHSKYDSAFMALSKCLPRLCSVEYEFSDGRSSNNQQWANTMRQFETSHFLLDDLTRAPVRPSGRGQLTKRRKANYCQPLELLTRQTNVE